MSTPSKNDPHSPRVIRGGGWLNDGASWVRSASRGAVVPAFRYDSIGFRTSLTGRQPR